MIWDNAPSHRGDALRAYLATPGLDLHLVNLPSYSPDFNAPILDQSRHLGLGAPGADRQSLSGTRCAAVQEKVDDFFANLANNREAVKRRCRTLLQAQAEEMISQAPAHRTCHANVGFTLVFV